MILLTSTACGSPIGSSATLPLQPNHIPRAILERGLDRDRHPAGQRRAGSVRNGHAVGNDNQSRAHASSQLDDSLVAVLMIPAME